MRRLLRCALLFAACGIAAGCRPNEVPNRAEGSAANVAAPANSRAKRTRVRVAAAADLKFALDDIVAAFRNDRPEIEMATTFGSSGNFFTQLSNKAPFDVFLSADKEYPKRLIADGRADGTTEFRYAVGQIVLWVPKGSPVDPERLGIAALLDGAVKKIAIANPKFAPYGRAAEAALKSLGVYDRVKDRLVLGENIAQAAQFVSSGGADAGILAHSLTVSPAFKDQGRSWIVPQSAYPRIEQAGVVLSWAEDRDAALSFCRFLQGERGQSILADHGFARPSP